MAYYLNVSRCIYKLYESIFVYDSRIITADFEDTYAYFRLSCKISKPQRRIVTVSEPVRVICVVDYGSEWSYEMNDFI